MLMLASVRRYIPFAVSPCSNIYSIMCIKIWPAATIDLILIRIHAVIYGMEGVIMINGFVPIGSLHAYISYLVIYSVCTPHRMAELH